jgi:hypothetical protein
MRHQINLAEDQSTKRAAIFATAAARFITVRAAFMTVTVYSTSCNCSFAVKLLELSPGASMGVIALERVDGLK